jgi:hypothetical protein
MIGQGRISLERAMTWLGVLFGVKKSKTLLKSESIGSDAEMIAR